MTESKTTVYEIAIAMIVIEKTIIDRITKGNIIR